MVLDLIYIFSFALVSAIVYFIFWKTRTVDHDSLRSLIQLASACQLELESVRRKMLEEQRSNNHELLLLELEVVELRQIVANISGGNDTQYRPKESRTTLYNYLNDSFSDDQISLMFFQMAYDEESITGNSVKPKKIRDLITHAERHSEMEKLREVIKQIAQ